MATNTDPLITTTASFAETASLRDWLWPGRMMLGQVTALVGDGGLLGGRGVGKGWLTCAMVAHVSTGRTWPDGLPCPAGSVLMVNAHDGPELLAWRLRGCGADPDRVHVLPAMPTLRRLEDAVSGLRDCRLVVIDPAGDYLGRGSGRIAASKLRLLAADFHAAVLVVGDAAEAYRSRQLGHASTDVWQVRTDPSDGGLRVLERWPVRSRECPGSPLAFRVGGDPASVTWEAAAPPDHPGEDAITWDVPVDQLPRYVRVSEVYTGERRGRPKWVQVCRLLGWTDFSPNVKPAGRYFTRRAFHVDPGDPYPAGDAPGKAVDPRTLAPGRRGRMTDRSWGRPVPVTTPTIDTPEPR